VLYHVRDVQFTFVDANLLERLVQEMSGGAYEGLPDAVFLVAGLLADEHDPGVVGTLAEYGLGRRFPEVACAAAAGGTADRVESATTRLRTRACALTA
jgi:hypothetical protein